MSKALSRCGASIHQTQPRRRWARLAQDYALLLAWERESWPINFPDEGFSEPEFRRSLEIGLRYHRVYIYELAGESIGWLWLDLNSSVEAAHIRHIQVDAAHWGRGLGVFLIQDAIRIARREGRSAVTLNVTKKNSRAVRLYKGQGFHVDRDNGSRQRMRIEVTDESFLPSSL